MSKLTTDEIRERALATARADAVHVFSRERVAQMDPAVVTRIRAYAAGQTASVEPDRERELLRAVVTETQRMLRERVLWSADLDRALHALAEHDRAAGRKP